MSCTLDLPVPGLARPTLVTRLLRGTRACANDRAAYRVKEERQATPATIRSIREAAVARTITRG